MRLDPASHAIPHLSNCEKSYDKENQLDSNCADILCTHTSPRVCMTGKLLLTPKLKRVLLHVYIGQNKKADMYFLSFYHIHIEDASRQTEGVGKEGIRSSLILISSNTGGLLQGLSMTRVFSQVHQ